MSKVQKAIDALDGCDEYSLRHHMSEVSILIEGYAEAQSELARVQKISDNYYALLVDRGQELAALREELDTMTAAAKAVRDEWRIDQQRLADAERRNAELEVFERFAGYLLDHCEGETIYEESLQRWLSESIKLYKPTESGASV